MSTRETAPVGAPCWTDLWTSNVEVSRTFYSGLFGWEAQDPSPEFGGYFMFTRHGVPVAGAMGDMDDMNDMKANNAWKIYLSTNDISVVLERGERDGAHFFGPPMPVADLGTQVVFSDPSGAALGAWQPGSFSGFSVLEEHGTPGWFELHTNNFTDALSFYQDVFGVHALTMSDSDEFRYATLRSDTELEVAGIFDASSMLGDSQVPYWTTYWQVDDVDASVQVLRSLGGSVIDGPVDTPYGRIATVADPMGAQFRLRTGQGAS
ncbi:MAG: VOC family protein [Acidimicrobiales bacterium]